MRIRTYYLLLCLPTLGVPSHLLSQEAMYVYNQGTCQAFDIRHVESVDITEEKVEILPLAATYNIADLDSITFSGTLDESTPIGWWGDMQNGGSAYYDTANCAETPDMMFDFEDSLCTSALYYPMMTMPSDSRRRVGKKWRYVKNTLTRRHKFQIHLNDVPPLNTEADTDDDGHSFFDLSSLLSHAPSSEIQQVVNYWYHPKASAPLPSAPVFGEMNTKHYELGCFRVPQYQVTVYDGDAPIECTIRFEIGYGFLPLPDYQILGDSIILKYPNKSKADEAFSQMDTQSEYPIYFGHWENIIVISEFYQESPMTFEEIMRWVVRFDLDLCKPIYIREENPEEEMEE